MTDLVDKSASQVRLDSMEFRLARLEAASQLAVATALDPASFWLGFALSVMGLALAWKGVGDPNHVYPIAVAICVTVVSYHRGWLRRPAQPMQWIVAIPNALALGLLLKLILGGGERHPLFWMKYPAIRAERAQGDWWKWFPSWELRWEGTELSAWNVDLTVIQAFLVVLVLVGSLLRVQLFASLVAFLLVVLSLPALTEFDWKWVFPSLLVVAAAWYVQAPRPYAPLSKTH